MDNQVIVTKILVIRLTVLYQNLIKLKPLEVDRVRHQMPPVLEQ